MSGLRKLPSGKWQSSVYMQVDGKQKRKYFTARTKREAIAMANEWQYTHQTTGKFEEHTVRYCLEEWIESKSSILAIGTYKKYCSYLKNDFKDVIDLRLDELSLAIIQSSINKECAKNSPKTVRNKYVILLSVLRDYGYDFKVRFPKPNKRETVVPTNEDIKKIFEITKDTEMELPYLFSALLGLRVAEISALTWEDINFKKKTVRINKAHTINEFNRVVNKEPKTESSKRVLVLPEELLVALKKYKKPSGRIIQVPFTSITKRHKKILEQNNIVHFRFHDLRHYCASVLITIMPDLYAQKILGHRSNRMLREVYAHTFEDKQMEYYEKLNEHSHSLFVAQSLHDTPKTL